MKGINGGGGRQRERDGDDLCCDFVCCLANALRIVAPHHPIQHAIIMAS